MENKARGGWEREQRQERPQIMNRNSSWNIEHLEKNSDSGKRNWCCEKVIGEIQIITKGNRKKN